MRWIDAAAPEASSNAAAAPVGVLVSCSTLPNSARKTIQRPTRRIGRTRCGDAVTITAPGTDSDNGGKYGNDPAARSESHTGGQSPSTIQPKSSEPPRDKTPAKTRSRSSDQRRRATAETITITARSTGRNISSAQKPRKPLGIAATKAMTERSIPAGG